MKKEKWTEEDCFRIITLAGILFIIMLLLSGCGHVHNTTIGEIICEYSLDDCIDTGEKHSIDWWWE